MPWTGYAYWNAEFYTDHHLSGAPVRKLETNTVMETLDNLGCGYMVRVEKSTGFI